MPLIIEGRVPKRWEERRRSRIFSLKSDVMSRECIRLALINNMPDSALEDTELQFFELLDVASGEMPVTVKLYSLTGVPRTDRGERHLNSFYFEFDDLWQSQFDGVIVSGTEPHHPNLEDEPYWNLLADVFDWAERHTISAILSCLAAHASVLHSDGIKRHRLADKRFGVFRFRQNLDHALMKGAPDVLQFPHSRWNEVKDDDLVLADYVVLTKSADAGVDAFAKKRCRSLFVYLQGHPEYGVDTLLKEYRRDVKRFLRYERETFPAAPHGYFDQAATGLLDIFRDRALSDRREDTMVWFPESLSASVQIAWQESAALLYRNWLHYIASRKTDGPGLSSFAGAPSVRSESINKDA